MRSSSRSSKDRGRRAEEVQDPGRPTGHRQAESPITIRRLVRTACCRARGDLGKRTPVLEILDVHCNDVRVGVLLEKSEQVVFVKI